MDTNLLYLILGIFATIVVGYLGIWITIKFLRRTKILYFENSCFSLFTKTVENLKELEINYKGSHVDTNLIFYRGTFFNSGNTDIDKSVIYRTLEAILPENYEWKSVEICKKSDEINLEFQCHEKVITFSWDIFKENEFFTFEAIVEYKPQTTNDKHLEKNRFDPVENLSNKINFTHRIKDLKAIKKEEMPTKSMSYTAIAVIGALTLLLVFFVGYSSIKEFKNPSQSVFHEIILNSKSQYIQFESYKNKIKITDRHGVILLIVQPTNINDIKLTGKIKILSEDSPKSIFYFGISFTLFFLLVLIFLFIEALKERTSLKRFKEFADL